ncbi:MAG: cytochrome c nitrite reductase small subunit [Bacteroidales bacterium]|nr:cytochrome c nitrite reductase small subunit [Bacteroidales bacterium]
MSNLLKVLIPPPSWRLPVIILLGIFVGLFIYTFKISNAASYLSDDPKTCVNCHVMNPQYATWFHSSHRENANCNDCHVPHNNVVNKYFFKAKDGMRHATIFTLRNEPQVIMIKEEGKEVVQNNCIRCHQKLFDDKHMTLETQVIVQHDKDRQCWECHREVPHGRVNSLSSVPHARVPKLDDPVPKWLKKMMKD